MSKVLTIVFSFYLSVVCFAQSQSEVKSIQEVNSYCLNSYYDNLLLTSCDSDTAQFGSSSALVVTVKDYCRMGTFTIPLSTLVYNGTTGYCQWEYDLSHYVDIYGTAVSPPCYDPNALGNSGNTVLTKLARLQSLSLRFRLTLPYWIICSYTIDFENVVGDSHLTAEFKTSSLLIPVDVYQGRIVASDGGQEMNHDGWFQKSAIGQNQYDPPGLLSMEYYDVRNSGGTQVFQRGWSWLSCDSDDCVMSVYLSYPPSPYYTSIYYGNIDKMWIEHTFVGSVGDRFTGEERFTVIPE